MNDDDDISPMTPESNAAMEVLMRAAMAFLNQSPAGKAFADAAPKIANFFAQFGDVGDMGESALRQKISDMRTNLSDVRKQMNEVRINLDDVSKNGGFTFSTPEKLASLTEAEKRYEDTLKSALARLNALNEARAITNATPTPKAGSPGDVRGSSIIDEKAVREADAFRRQIENLVSDTAVARAEKFRDSMQAMQRALNENKIGGEQASEAMKILGDAYVETELKINGTADAAKKFKDELDGILSGTASHKSAEMAHEIDVLREAMNKGVKNGGIDKRQFDEGMDVIKQKYKDTTNDMTAFGEQAARNIQDTFADFLFDPFDGGLKGMAEGFINTMRRMAAEAAAANILGSFGKSAAGAAISGFFGSTNIFSASVPSYAVGTNYVPRDGLAMIHKGERIIPASQNVSGGGTNVVVNVIESPGKGGRINDRQEGGNRIIDVLVEQVDARIGANITRGMGATTTALERTFGLNRVAGSY